MSILCADFHEFLKNPFTTMDSGFRGVGKEETEEEEQ
jgi:hypothetical protein